MFVRVSAQCLCATAARYPDDSCVKAVIHTAAPGSPSEEALRLLSAISTQRMDVTR